MSFEDELQRRLKAEQEAASKSGTTTPGAGSPVQDLSIAVTDAVNAVAPYGDEAGRQLGLTARALGPAAAGAGAGFLMGGPPGALAGAAAGGVAMPLADLGVTGYNYLTGNNNRLPSQAFEDLLTKIGLPEPKTGVERGVQSASRGVIDAITGAGAAKQFATALRSAPVQQSNINTFGNGNVKAAVAETLAANPTLQATSSALGATAGQAVVENGGSRPTAMAASILASTLPGVRPNHLLPNMAPDGSPAAMLRQILQREGVPLTPAQRLNNPFGSIMESVMKYMPTTASLAAGAEDAAQRGYTSALMRHAGQNSDNALPETLNQAQRQFGQRYDALERATMFQPDQQFGLELGQMRQGFVRGLDDSLFNAFEKDLQRLEQFANARSQNAVMPGENYHAIDAELRVKASRAQGSDDPRIQNYGAAIEQLRTSLQEAMKRSALRQQNVQIGKQTLSGQQLAQAWADTNREYAIFSRIKEAMGSATGRDKLNTGFIPPSAIAQTERSSLGASKYSMTDDPFAQLVRAGHAVLPDPVPNSGTAQRGMAQNMLTGGSNMWSKEGALGVGSQGGAAILAPVTSLALPHAVARAWYASPLTGSELAVLTGHGVQNAPMELPPKKEPRKKPISLINN